MIYKIYIPISIKGMQLKIRFTGWGKNRFIDRIIPEHIDLFLGKHQFWMQPKDIFTPRFMGYFRTITFTIDD